MTEQENKQNTPNEKQSFNQQNTSPPFKNNSNDVILKNNSNQPIENVQNPEDHNRKKSIK